MWNCTPLQEEKLIRSIDACEDMFIMVANFFLKYTIESKENKSYCFAIDTMYFFRLLTMSHFFSPISRVQDKQQISPFSENKHYKKSLKTHGQNIELGKLLCIRMLLHNLSILVNVSIQFIGFFLSVTWFEIATYWPLKYKRSVIDTSYIVKYFTRKMPKARRKQYT